jgi:hypothetical protein
MARNELFFSNWKLLGVAGFAFFGGGTIAALAMGVQAGERIRGLGFLRLLGQDGPFWFAIPGRRVQPPHPAGRDSQAGRRRGRGRDPL